MLLEMNNQAGGNARSGENDVSAYPWAAHYVPVPGPKAIYVRELFTDLGVLRDGVWNERYLCFSPQERLFLYGKWQEGIEPAFGLNRKDRDQFQKLEDLFGEFRHNGAFTIPMELGIERSPRDLDRFSFADWLRQKGIDSPVVLWYMNYCCRDDYGALAADTSAWAGVHYFSSRATEEKGPLTWPESSGWITPAAFTDRRIVCAHRPDGTENRAAGKPVRRTYRWCPVSYRLCDLCGADLLGSLFNRRFRPA